MKSNKIWNGVRIIETNIQEDSMLNHFKGWRHYTLQYLSPEQETSVEKHLWLPESINPYELEQVINNAV